MEIDEFFSRYQEFQLGDLPTETQCKETVGLAELITTDISTAIGQLNRVDLIALERLGAQISSLKPLREAIGETLAQGGRIFLCGCGATGRLSLLLESLWKDQYSDNRVCAFMAGGDVALVHSLEGFEDYPELGRKHLEKLGFSDNDLLISSTEGGETPFVIGATEAATELSKRKPFFLFCNPSEVLIKTIPRSKNVLTNTNINAVELFVGPMALSGSTRMQASTILQLAIGWCLLDREQSIEELYADFMKTFKQIDFLKLEPFINKEFQVYTEGAYVMYVPRCMALSVFTDTTERSPTFSLPSFENEKWVKGIKPSLCYVLIPSSETSAQAWQELIKREPSALNWEIDSRTSLDYLESFDFSRNAIENREERLDYSRQYLFEISLLEKTLHWSFGGLESGWELSTQSKIGQNTILKILLNTHSTLLMGKLGRYHSNIMTWVKPTNGKLVDRSIRYVRYLLQEVGIEKDYLEIAKLIYKYKNEALDIKPIVLRVVEELRKSE